MQILLKSMRHKYIRQQILIGMILTVTHTTIEQHQHQSRVVIQNDLSDISNYQNVIIAHPIWWGIPPRLIATLIDTLDLNGKKVATCATSGGTGYFRS